MYVAFKTSKLARRETSLIDMVNTSKAVTVRCYVRPEARVDKGVGSPTPRPFVGVVVARPWVGRIRSAGPAV
jgi:hypothetical protein